MDAITYRLDQFEGPLDLLLNLIAKNKVSIADIPIVAAQTRSKNASFAISNTKCFTLLISVLLYNFIIGRSPF